MEKDYKVGTKIEYEHKPTLNRIREYVKRNKRFPSIKYVAKSIATDHIKEFPRKRYYTNDEYGLVHFEHELGETRKKHLSEKREHNKKRKPVRRTGLGQGRRIRKGRFNNRIKIGRIGRF